MAGLPLISMMLWWWGGLCLGLGSVVAIFDWGGLGLGLDLGLGLGFWEWMWALACLWEGYHEGEGKVVDDNMTGAVGRGRGGGGRGGEVPGEKISGEQAQTEQELDLNLMEMEAEMVVASEEEEHKQKQSIKDDEGEVADGVDSRNPFTDGFKTLARRTLDQWHLPGLAIAVVGGNGTFFHVCILFFLSSFLMPNITTLFFFFFFFFFNSFPSSPLPIYFPL